MVTNIDWNDVVLHAGLAFAAVGVTAVFGVWGLAVANAAFWPLREHLQHDGVWTRQAHLEAWPAVAAGFVAAAVL